MGRGRRDLEKSGTWRIHLRFGFEREVELADEVRACLKCIQKESRDLILEAFTLTEADLSRKGVRNELAARLGINRNTLDQRISRALGRIRERMRRFGME
jgi:DNA-directed RNA polymerase specialized sigma24 family protein